MITYFFDFINKMLHKLLSNNYKCILPAPGVQKLA